MRRKHRVDLNQANVVQTLYKAGAQVQIMSGVGDGVPDTLVSYAGMLAL